MVNGNPRYSRNLSRITLKWVNIARIRMAINEKSINRLGGGTEEAEAENGEEDHVLENEDEVVPEVVVTMITDEAGENKQISAIETP